MGPLQRPMGDEDACAFDLFDTVYVLACKCLCISAAFARCMLLSKGAVMQDFARVLCADGGMQQCK
jgi:hypothetical protein